jgi:hypothetical protein
MTSWDMFAGTRYKTIYLKSGAFWDYQDQFNNVGFALGMLAKLPLLGYTTIDQSLGFGTGGDFFNPANVSPVNFRQERIESSETDYQLRLGHFFTPNVQVGLTNVFQSFQYSQDQWGIGPFANVYCGRLKISGEVTSGTENVRGWVNLAVALGKPPRLHRRDVRLINVDTIQWVTQAVERDLVIQQRRTFTGPLPPGP